MAGVRPVALTLEGSNLEEGSYELELEVAAPDGTRARSRASLEIGASPPQEGLLLYQETREVAAEVEFYNRALQHLSRMDLEAADRSLRIALDHNARFAPAITWLARLAPRE